jgi:hypothetical protein
MVMQPGRASSREPCEFPGICGNVSGILGFIYVYLGCLEAVSRRLCSPPKEPCRIRTSFPNGFDIGAGQPDPRFNSLVASPLIGFETMLTNLFPESSRAGTTTVGLPGSPRSFSWPSDLNRRCRKGAHRSRRRCQSIGKSVAPAKDIPIRCPPSSHFILKPPPERPRKVLYQKRGCLSILCNAMKLP